MLTVTESGDGCTEIHYTNLSMGLSKIFKNCNFKTQKFHFGISFPCDVTS